MSTFAVIALMMTVCSSGKAPECANKDVEKIVIEKTTVFGPNMLVRYMKEQRENNKIKLKSIRTNAQDENLKRSECAAELVIEAGGSHFSVEYTAQYTSDGKLFVDILKQGEVKTNRQR